MNVPKVSGILSSMLFLSLVLIKFQNCSQAIPNQNYKTTENGEVRLVDQWNNEKLAFSENLIVVRSTASELNLEGACPKDERNQLSWSLNSLQNGEPKASGVANCSLGFFKMSVELVSDLNCGEDYSLTVQSPSGESDVSVVRRKCDPLWAAIIDGESNPVQKCYMELESVQGEKQCFHSCYNDGKLFSRDYVLPNQCKL